MELTLRHPSRTYNFVAGLTFLENLCTHRIEHLKFHIYFLIKGALILILGSSEREGTCFSHFLSGIEGTFSCQTLRAV